VKRFDRLWQTSSVTTCQIIPKMQEQYENIFKGYVILE